MYASGPFTRIVFALDRRGIQLLTPRMHAVGERGDLVTTITHCAPHAYRNV